MGDILKDLGTTGIANPDDVSTVEIHLASGKTRKYINLDYLEISDRSIALRQKFGGRIHIIPFSSIDELIIEPKANP